MNENDITGMDSQDVKEVLNIAFLERRLLEEVDGYKLGSTLPDSLTATLIPVEA